MALSFNALMRHLRDNCGVNINGSLQKRQLTSYGFYHGYKGYRFYRERTIAIPFTEYDEIVAVNEYDNSLKAAIYPPLMFLETALKSIVTNEVVSTLKSPSFDSVYAFRMTDKPMDTALKSRRLKLRDKIYSTLSFNYGKNPMVTHFYNKGSEVPIWAVFETVDLGVFAYFIESLNENTREALLTSMDMLDVSIDTDRQMLKHSLYALRSLRNAVAHNAIIFDGRFRDRKINRNLITWLEKETAIRNITFMAPIDYIILICCLLKKVDFSNDRASGLISNYDAANTELSLHVPTVIYGTIVQAHVSAKIRDLRTYLGI